MGKHKEPDNNIHTKYRYEFELKNEIEYKKKIAANTEQKSQEEC